MSEPILCCFNCGFTTLGSVAAGVIEEPCYPACAQPVFVRQIVWDPVDYDDFTEADLA